MLSSMPKAVALAEEATAGSLRLGDSGSALSHKGIRDKESGIRV